MKPKMYSKKTNSRTKNIISDSSSRKSKSIRVSPLESQANTGCKNSPKNSVSPVRTPVKINNFISRYVSKVLSSNFYIKKTPKKSSSHKRSNSENRSNDPPIKKPTKTCRSSHENTLKKPEKPSAPSSDKLLSKETSRPTMFKTADPEDLIREKIIQHIKDSFLNFNLAPPTTKDFYKFGKVLGNGSFGKVCLATCRLTGLKVAVKVIEKAFIKDEVIRRKIFQEVFIMKKLSHKNIIRLLEVFESKNSFMIVLEYAGGGDLLQIIKQKGRLTEEECKGIFYQLIDSVKACHSMGIIHRDIKLDNILLTSDYTEIKLCDFGVSRFSKAGEKVNEQCGTPAYLAPEIIVDKGYEPFYVDIWSMGVLLYAMMSASVPFKAKTLPELHKIILKGKYEVPEYFSQEATDFIAKMLNPIPHHRISLENMKKHPWFNDFSADSFCEAKFSITRQNDILKKLAGFGFPKDYVLQSLNLKDVNHASALYSLIDLATS